MKDFKINSFIWALLLILTGFTIWISELHAGFASIIIPLFIATAKSVLVLLFFMRLKYENKLFKLLILAPLITLAVIIGLTFTDILYR